jgi:hypothetical protein
MEAGVQTASQFVPLVSSMEAGRWIGRFRAEGLVRGRYDVWIRPAPHVGRDDGLPEPSPRQSGVEVERGDLLFEIDDESKARVLEVTVTAARGDEPVAVFDLMLIKKEARIEVDPRPFTDGFARLELAGDPGGGLLANGAEDFADDFVIVHSTPDADGVVRVRQRLVAGWGAFVQAYALVDGKDQPIENVEILAVGSPCGKTDANGFCALRLAARPLKLEVRHEDYALERAHGPLDAGGRVTAEERGTLRNAFSFVLRRR